jgi:pyruvate/2-oxoglutarate/acetoin dehydrogenase E1 component
MQVQGRTYFDELTKAMGVLADHPKTIFVGQAVSHSGQAAYETFSKVAKDKRLEMPVCEDFQMVFCTGLALEGYIPISFYPRWDFLLLAANQLINHLDKIPLMTKFKPKVIIRTAVGRSSPLNPGPQHTQNHTQAFRQMLHTVDVHELFNPNWIVPTYEQALKSDRSSIIVEHMARYK